MLPIGYRDTGQDNCEGQEGPHSLIQGAGHEDAVGAEHQLKEEVGCDRGIAQIVSSSKADSSSEAGGPRRLSSP
jgi:hypothetical protein